MNEISKQEIEGPLNRARTEGYRAGYNDESKKTSYNEGSDLYKEWMIGYQEGLAKKRETEPDSSFGELH